MISETVLKPLLYEHGIDYLKKQISYTVNCQIKYKTGKRENPISDPSTYLEFACKENYAKHQIKEKVCN